MIRGSILSLVLLTAGATAESMRAQNVLAIPSESGTKASLTVTLAGIRNDKGQVFIQLWRSSEGFPLARNKYYKFVVIDSTKAVNGGLTAIFMDLPFGTYAISALHDENRNGKMDSNAFGAPKEGWAVSNDVVTHLRAPSFAQASFQISAAERSISIALHY